MNGRKVSITREWRLCLSLNGLSGIKCPSGFQFFSCPSTRYSVPLHSSFARRSHGGVLQAHPLDRAKPFFSLLKGRHIQCVAGTFPKCVLGGWVEITRAVGSTGHKWTLNAYIACPPQAYLGGLEQPKNRMYLWLVTVLDSKKLKKFAAISSFLHTSRA